MTVETEKRADLDMDQLLVELAAKGVDCFDACLPDTKRRLIHLHMAGWRGDDATSDIELTENLVEIFAAETVTEQMAARLKMCHKIEEMAVDATRTCVDNRLPGFVADHNHDASKPDLNTALEDIGLMPLMRLARNRCGG